MARGAISPRQLKDGRTVFDVRYRSSNGRQCHKRGFARRREAERYLADRLALVHRGALIVTDVRFEAYFARGWPGTACAWRPEPTATTRSTAACASSRSSGR